MELLYNLQSILSVGLQLVLVVFLIRSAFRRYFLLFCYSAVYLLTSVAEVVIFQTGGRNTRVYTTVYWTDEVILDLLLFMIVILLTYRAAEGSPLRRAVGRILAVVAVAAMALPFIIQPRPLFSPRWFNLTSQFLNFGGAIMNMALWTALIASRRRDPQLLTVSAGLGIAVTGAAINYGVLQLTRQAVFVQIADVFGAITHIAGVAIWCWAFRPAAQNRSTQTHMATHNA